MLLMIFKCQEWFSEKKLNFLLIRDKMSSKCDTVFCNYVTASVDGWRTIIDQL